MTGYYCFKKKCRESAKGLKIRKFGAMLYAAGIVLVGIISLAGLVNVSFAAGDHPGTTAAKDIHATGKAHGEAMKTGLAARVNGAAITRDAVILKMARLADARQGQESGSQDASASNKKEALDKLILQELAYQKATAEGMKVSRDELEAAMAELKSAVGGEEKYRELLESRRKNEDDVRKEIERNLLVKRIFEKEVSAGIVISEDDLKKEYENIKGEFTRPEKVVVIDLVFFLDTEDRNSMIKSEEVLGKLKKDRELDPFDLPLDGTFIVRELEIDRNKHKELYDEARKLGEGEVSGVIKASDSLHIIKLKKYSAEVVSDFGQVRGFIERKVRAREQHKRFTVWEAELRKGAKIELFDDEEVGGKKD